jgi:hypothetical protein
MVTSNVMVTLSPAAKVPRFWLTWARAWSINNPPAASARSPSHLNLNLGKVFGTGLKNGLLVAQATVRLSSPKPRLFRPATYLFSARPEERGLEAASTSALSSGSGILSSSEVVRC